MMYNPTDRDAYHPAGAVERRTRRSRSSRWDRDTAAEVMSFSVDQLPGEEADEQGSASQTYVADHFPHLSHSWSQPIVQQVSQDSRRMRPVTREGINRRAGVAVLLAAGVLLLGITAVSYGQISVIGREANNARERIEGIREQCYQVERKIADSATELNITTSAVELGMVSSRGVDVIYLEVPSDATYSNPGALGY